jgi:hypothetical protein
MIKRRNGWEGLLDEFVRSRRAAKFSWGTNDCVLFACDAVLVMTGEDLARGFRDEYATALQAKRTLRKSFGAETVGELADVMGERLELRVVPPPFAQRGDVVLLDRELGESLGIVTLCGTAIWAPAEYGLVEVDFREAQRAWRI